VDGATPRAGTRTSASPLSSSWAWLTPRRQMVVIGLAGTALPLVLIGTALGALERVRDAHTAVAVVSEARADFQDADMAHDAIRADLLELVQPGSGVTPDEARAALDRDVADYRRYLRDVDGVDLSPALESQVRAVRPLQERYVQGAQDLGRTSLTDPDRVDELLPALTDTFTTLVEQQAVITDAMTEQVTALQQDAEKADSQVRMSVVGAGVVTLLGMLGLTYLLDRLGGTLASILARERGVAETLQHSLLPDRLPDVPGVRLAARYVPGAVGTQVGGDWYDVVPLPSGEVGLVMGDVVGHDLDAAASMGQLRNALRALAAEGAAPHTVLERLNRLCVYQGLGGMATVLYAVLDPVLGTLRIANAGHYPPLLVHDGERVFLESDPCPPIGAVREASFTSAVHRLPAGSLLVLYTDGLVERRDVDVETGMSRLAGLVGSPDVDDLEGLCDGLLSGMLGDSAPHDDIAVLAVAAQARLGSHLDFTIPAQAEQLSVLRRTLERWLTEAGATDDEVYEITVACSEATTNAIEHAYGPGSAQVEVVCSVEEGRVTVSVRDWGQWRDARGRDRGRGLYLMRELMDDVEVTHGDRGTMVAMRRRLGVPLGAQTAGAGAGAAGGGEAREPVLERAGSEHEVPA
jgi:serine phosphatase RsbU (regulator of sigma subunit)/anti-sigma regulatory factor (Ser/Thr protein kinase)